MAGRLDGVRIRVLGSGAADGWPNPWCGCASCAAALEQGVVRGQTSVLVDDRLLIDLGPTVGLSVAGLGASLRDVDTVLITHRHVDHHFSQAWVWRYWSKQARPRTEVAPRLVMADANRSRDVRNSVAGRPA